MANRYALFSRPAGLGTIPDGWTEILPRPAAGQPFFDVARHGIVVYEHELRVKETAAFELPLLLGPEHYQLIQKLLASDMSTYARGYLKMASTDPQQFASHARERLKALWPGHPPVVQDFSAVIPLLVESLSQLHAKALEANKQAALDAEAARLKPAAPPAPSSASANPSPTEGPAQWFALAADGTIKSLGLHEDFDSADESEPHAVWIFREETARQWHEALSEHLSSQSPAPTLPRVLITVSGGVADWVADEGIDVEKFDFDDYQDDPENTRKPSAHFADLGQLAGVPAEEHAPDLDEAPQ